MAIINGGRGGVKQEIAALRTRKKSSMLRF
jgi:hypothetical protein